MNRYLKLSLVILLIFVVLGGVIFVRWVFTKGVTVVPSNGIGILVINPNFCELDNLVARDNCYKTVAKQEGDVSICGRIVDTTSNKECIEGVKLVTDPSLCEEMVDVSKKDFCFFRQVFTTYNSALCENILNLNTKDECYARMAYVLGLGGLCEKVSYSYDPKCGYEGLDCKWRDVCYMGVASQTKDIDWCQSIGNKELKEKCIEGIAGFFKFLF